MNVSITEIRPGLYQLDDGRVREFLFVSPEKALLIDCGFGDTPLLPLVRQLTQAPVELLLTHGDRDHTGNIAAFGGAYLHEKDWPLVNEAVELKPLHEGDVFCCGPWKLEVLEIPGHSYGSVAFFDREQRLLLSGDSVQEGGPIFLFGAHRNLDLYLQSLERLEQLAPLVDTVLPSHHACPVNSAAIAHTLADARALKAGELSGQPHDRMPCGLYQGRWTSFLYAGEGK